MQARESAFNLSSELDEDELSALRQILKEHPKTGNHLEIGTAAGGTLRELLTCYKEPRPNFVVIDPFTYFPDQFEIVLRNLNEAKLSADNIEFRKGYSWPHCAEALANGEGYDFMLIDGHHGHKHVMQDLRWTRMLNPKGIVCMHDYGTKFPGVAWSTDYFLRRNKNYKILAHVGTLMVLQKVSVSQSEVSNLDVLIADIVRKLYVFRKSIKKRFSLGF